MNVLIVFAHPEPRSFNGAMKDLAEAELTRLGHSVRVSDLYAKGFKAIADAGDFAQRADPERLDYPAEQGHAHAAGTTAPDIAAEQADLQWADHVIFQFPMWWYSVPAILKGWLERVMTIGFAYGRGKMFDTAGLSGTRAMVSCTTHGLATSYEPTGWHGDIDRVLWPLLNGLRFVGFEVLPPMVAYNVIRCGDQERAAYFDAYRECLARLPETDPLPFHKLDEFDETGRLQDRSTARTPGQWTD